MSQTPLQHIGPYEVVGQIGAGGMATVYKAYQPKLDRHVAVKIMHQAFQADPNFAARFEREARIVARLDHPNIVGMYDYDLHEGRPYLVMKYIEGRTLKHILSERPPTLDDILRMLPPIADALSYAHGQGILHRDVKPSNIIIETATGTPYLMDFGLARVATAGESTMSAEMILGTPQYISPEQAQGAASLDARTDVYSLGVVLYELVAGQVPFTGDTPYIIVHKHIFTAPPPPSSVNPELPPAIDAVILRALAKDPADRYPTANALIADFRAAVAASGLSSLDAERASRVARRETGAATPTPSASKPPVYRVDSQGGLVNAAPGAVTPPRWEDDGGAFVRIPSPLSEDSALVSPPRARPANWQDLLDDVAARFREAFVDIRGSIEDRDNMSRARGRAEKLFVEVKTQVEQAAAKGGVVVEFGPNAVKVTGTGRSGSSLVRVRQARLIQRDWGRGESAIRRRLKERAEQRNGFLVHLAIFLLVAFAFRNSAPALSDALREALAEEPDLRALGGLNIPLVVMLLWAGGLLAHGIETFSRTGRRWERRRRALDEAMTTRHGEDWIDTADDRAYKQVRTAVYRRVDAVPGLFRHAVSALFTALAGFVIWPPIAEVLPSLLADAPGALQTFASYNLPVLFALLMAFTVLLHAVGVLLSGVVGAEAREREIERELARERGRWTDDGGEAGAKAKRKRADEESRTDAAGVRLTEDGEFTESFVEEIGELDEGERRNAGR